MRRITALFIAIIFSGILLSACSKSLAELSASELIDFGEKYLLELDYEQAAVYFERLIEIEKRNPRGYTGLAEAYLGLDEYGDAVNALRDGIERLPDSRRLLRDAAEILEKIIDAAPETRGAYIELAEIYIARGDDDNALDVLLRGEERWPRNTDISEMLDGLTGIPPVESPPPVVSPSELPEQSPEEATNTAFYEFVMDNMQTPNMYNEDMQQMRLTGGGLLNFNSGETTDLVLIYEGEASLTGCQVYSFDNGQIAELFTLVMYDGGNWGDNSIVSSEGRGAICGYIFPMPEGAGYPHAYGIGSYDYQIYENGELVSKLYYYQNNYVVETEDDIVVDHQVWEIRRDGVLEDSGTAEPDARIPQIEAAAAEADTAYGTMWTPLPVNDLLVSLERGANMSVSTAPAAEYPQYEPIIRALMDYENGGNWDNSVLPPLLDGFDTFYHYDYIPEFYYALFDINSDGGMELLLKSDRNGDYYTGDVGICSIYNGTADFILPGDNDNTLGNDGYNRTSKYSVYSDGTVEIHVGVDYNRRKRFSLNSANRLDVEFIIDSYYHTYFPGEPIDAYNEGFDADKITIHDNSFNVIYDMNNIQITETEAEKIVAQYSQTTVEPDWRPLLDFAR